MLRRPLRQLWASTLDAFSRLGSKVFPRRNFHPSPAGNPSAAPLVQTVEPDGIQDMDMEPELIQDLAEQEEGAGLDFFGQVLANADPTAILTNIGYMFRLPEAPTPLTDVEDDQDNLLGDCQAQTTVRHPTGYGATDCRSASDNTASDGQKWHIIATIMSLAMLVFLADTFVVDFTRLEIRTLLNIKEFQTLRDIHVVQLSVVYILVLSSVWMVFQFAARLSRLRRDEYQSGRATNQHWSAHTLKAIWMTVVNFLAIITWLTFALTNVAVKCAEETLDIAECHMDFKRCEAIAWGFPLVAFCLTATLALYNWREKRRGQPVRPERVSLLHAPP